jgi:alpha-D-ribose 1-methylphosphonate 5-triphosphate diphosphatase
VSDLLTRPAPHDHRIAEHHAPAALIAPPAEPVLFTNARLVTPDAVLTGWLAVVDGRIAEMGEGRAPEAGQDLRGDLLIPGLVELHTDNLETHFMPRPKVLWHALSAVLAYDAQIASSGITTVYDSLRAGLDYDGGGMGNELLTLAHALAEASAQGLTRSEHRIHLRCEVPAEDVIDTVSAFAAHFDIDLISLMDHTPGFRQFRDIEKYLFFYSGKSGKSRAEVDADIALRQRIAASRADDHRRRLVELARVRAIRLASHDDTTVGEVAASVADGVVLAEFPTTIEAAQACRDNGIAVMMGAPNLIRGGSHSGNVAASELAALGLLDVFSSDYVPASLLMAAFDLPRRVRGIDLPHAMRTVTLNPARAMGLTDRGALVPGLRADLVRVRDGHAAPVVREVWRAGERVL